MRSRAYSKRLSDGSGEAASTISKGNAMKYDFKVNAS
jgi:hypothetical protein